MGDVAEPAVCEACGRSLSQQVGPGRRRRYCDATCRSAARRRRESGSVVKQSLTTVERKAKLYGMESASSGSTASALADLGKALVSVQHAEAQLREAVDAAREAGRTWAEIGEILGTTRQAAFQR